MKQIKRQTQREKHLAASFTRLNSEDQTYMENLTEQLALINTTAPENNDASQKKKPITKRKP